MKKLMFIFLTLAFIAGQQSIAGGNDKTITNLKTAFKAASTASAKYAAFARQAKQEGLMQIAIMFEATSGSEQIHASNHQAVLEKMGQKIDKVSPEYSIKTTRENLEEAIKSVSNEVTAIYPAYLAAARDEDELGAQKSYRWAMDTGKKHLIMFQNTLNALIAKKPDTLPRVYWVCPKCGNTYDVPKPEASCSFCSTKSEKFIKFGK